MSLWIRGPFIIASSLVLLFNIDVDPMTALAFSTVPYLSFHDSRPLSCSSTRHPFVFLLQSKQSSDEEEEEETQKNDQELFYDDFGDFVIGSDENNNNDEDGNSSRPVYNDIGETTAGSSSSSFMNALQTRISQQRTDEMKREARISKNWRVGNWKVRGFALDKSDPITQQRGGASGEATADDDNGNATSRRLWNDYEKFLKDPPSFLEDGGSAAGLAKGLGSDVDDDDDDDEKQERREKKPAAAGSSARTSSRGNKSGGESVDRPIHVSKIAMDQSRVGAPQLSLPSNKNGLIAVGRTDGSVCLVRLGTEYLTRFTAVQKVTIVGDSPLKQGNDDNDVVGGKGKDYLDKTSETEGMNVRIESELVSEDELQERLKEQQRQPVPKKKDEEEAVGRGPYEDPFGDGIGDSFGTNMSDEEMAAAAAAGREDDNAIPFEVMYHFQAAESGETINALLFDDDTVYTSGGNTGEIKVWVAPDEDDVVTTTTTTTDDAGPGEGVEQKQQKELPPPLRKKMIPVRNLSHAHSDKIVALRTLSMNGDDDEHNLLLSVSVDGSFALWDRSTGDLVYRCQCMNAISETASITCADVDTTGKEHIIYLGLNTGHVVGYVVNEVVLEASVGGECPTPSCRFLAHAYVEGGVTAIKCAGDGTLAQSTRGSGEGRRRVPRSTILLTGGADGTVKQWEMMARKIEPSDGPSDVSAKPFTKLEHWPRMSTQRMQRRAHLFTGHSGPVTALACTDPSKMLSASADGTVRVWSPSKGEELFLMDGFTDRISSLCLDHDLLVTDGMEHYVCLHDFDVDETEVEEGYEFEW